MINQISVCTPQTRESLFTNKNTYIQTAEEIHKPSKILENPSIEDIIKSVSLPADSPLEQLD